MLRVGKRKDESDGADGDSPKTSHQRKSKLKYGQAVSSFHTFLGGELIFNSDHIFADKLEGKP